MFVINAPGAAVQKMADRGCVICKFVDKSLRSNSNASMCTMTVPIDRIIVLQKTVFTINNMDLFIPTRMDSTYFDPQASNILYAQIDYIEPFEYGNIFATIGNRDDISLDEMQFMAQLTKDTIARIALEHQNTNFMYGTQLACLPDNLKEKLGQYDKAILTEDHPNEVMVATQQAIPLQQIVEKVNPTFLEDYTDLGGTKVPDDRLYNKRQLDLINEHMRNCPNNPMDIFR